MLWHLDSDGSVLRAVRAENENMRANDSHWDGRHYWIMDFANNCSWLFDREGRFLFRSDVYFRQFIPMGERLFVLDTSNHHYRDARYTPLVKEVSYQIENGQLSVTTLGSPFKRATPLQDLYKLNFKKAWLAADGERILAMDQLADKIWIYDAQARRQEGEIGTDKPFFPGSISLELPGYEPPPLRFPTDSSVSQQLWYYSWSRIAHFSKIGEQFLVTYEIPDPANPERSLLAIQAMTATGQPTDRRLVVDGHFMGYREGKVYVFSQGNPEDGGGPRVDVYPF